MTSDVSIQVEAFTTPGTLLRCARLAAGFSEREVEDQLNLMPGYVAILERDDYQSLRSPAFARGYVRSYAQLMKLDSNQQFNPTEKVSPSETLVAIRKLLNSID